MMWLSVLAVAVLAVAGGQDWGFRLAWEHNGREVTHYDLCIDAEPCRVLNAVRSGGDETWEAPLPLLAPGPHRLIVRACNGASCAPGSPDVAIRVKAYW